MIAPTSCNAPDYYITVIKINANVFQQFHVEKLKAGRVFFKDCFQESYKETKKVQEFRNSTWDSGAGYLSFDGFFRPGFLNGDCIDFLCMLYQKRRRLDVMQSTDWKRKFASCNSFQVSWNKGRFLLSWFFFDDVAERGTI